jgi:hypothetical protein
MVNEELLTEERYRRLSGSQQLELITKYCHDIEDRIRSAASRHEAEAIAAEACAGIEEACQSSLIRSALGKNVENLISKYWNVPGRSSEL